MIDTSLLVGGVRVVKETAAAVAVFFWAVNSDQYSDLDKAANQILFERQPQAQQPQKQQEETEDDIR